MTRRRPVTHDTRFRIHLGQMARSPAMVQMDVRQDDGVETVHTMAFQFGDQMIDEFRVGQVRSPRIESAGRQERPQD